MLTRFFSERRLILDLSVRLIAIRAENAVANALIKASSNESPTTTPLNYAPRLFITETRASQARSLASLNNSHFG